MHDSGAVTLTPATIEQAVRDFITRYHRKTAGAGGPLRFVKEVLLRGKVDAFGQQQEPDGWQCGVLLDYGAEERRITIRSGHGVGKTAVDAWIIVYQLVFEFPQNTVVTAPTSDQLFDALYKEVVIWMGVLPGPIRARYTIKTDRIELTPTKERPDLHQHSWVSFRTARPDSPEALAGVHCEEGSVLLIGDEASGISEKIFDAASGSMSGRRAITILSGNPVRSSGFFWGTHMGAARHDWKRHHVSCEEHPRISKDFIESKLREYNNNREDPRFRVRVCGEFPLADANSMFPFEIVDPAVDREIEPSNTRPIWGLDPAYTGDNLSSLCVRRGAVIDPIITWSKLDTMRLVGRVKNKWDLTPEPDRPEWICVDSIGIGSGVADRLRELGLPVLKVNVAELPAFGNQDKYLNLRAELYFKLRQWLEERNLSIPNNEKLIAQLLAINYDIVESTGKYKIESKKDMRKRGLESPDELDSVVLTLAVEAATGLFGRSGPRKTALKRDIRRVA